ncbi:unnamed protein product [Rotaria socialis]|uniref:Protein NO VEIN C-terminal domain-containing protein n=2 Tax=Rotaria socialis TaxID=392032 RepID=A0A817KE08_9BILA|nr:unnamed protein product [Rotaria socialis]
MTTNETSLRQCIEELSAKNTDYKFPEQAINQAESLKSLSSDLYTDNIRFIYELIQNADDAQARNISLTILEEKYFIIAHNGKAFDEKDLKGICGVNNGTKKKDLDKTGYKGLGFKAVFGKSDKVMIYSHGEYFRFDSSYQIKWNKEWGTDDQQTWEKENDRQFIYPWQINPVWTNENEIPSLISIFLNQKKKRIHVAYVILLNNIGEINSAINQLKQQPDLFLFLRNISQITFLAESSNYTISIARDLSHGLKQVFVNNKPDSQWIIKRFELNIPDDVVDKLSKDTKAPEKLRFIKKAEMFLAAKYKAPSPNEHGDMISGGIEKLREQDSVLFSYLPTKIFGYKFPVLINANFLTNVNREQIHTDSVWNQWLFGRISGEIFQWIKELVNDNKFRSQAYRLIPSELHSENNILTKRFNDSLAENIKHCNFIRNRKNQLLRVDQVIMDSTSMSKQSSFINVDSMREYINNNEKNPCQYGDDPFIDYDINLNQIGVKTFTWDHCIDMFKSDIFIKTHSTEENKRMIEYFFAKYLKIDTDNGMNIDIQRIPFLMDQNNHLQLIKNIYFPTDTIGDNGTIDFEYLFVNKKIVTWLSEKAQHSIKKWLTDKGVDERTDLTYLRKTIIPNAASYITQENAIKTIKMLFMLFQKNVITKKELDQLRKLKLLTTRKTLISAEQCFFCDQYKPRLQLEVYLKAKEDVFLSFDYVTNHNDRKEDEDLTEWRRFFIKLGVQEELHLTVFDRKLTSFEAEGYGFSGQYLSSISPDRKHKVDAFFGLTTITFMQHTQNNYEFAKFFWSDVMKNLNANMLTQKIKVYWGHSNRRGATEGTLLDDADYISWFVKHIKCMPTTVKTCELSNSIFVDNKELKDLCGKYMCFPSILLPQEKTNWHGIFDFKTKLSIDDYFDLLQKIRDDENYLKDNLDRVQIIYSHILKEIYYWSSDERKAAKARAKSLYLLTENDQWKLTSNLYFYMEGHGTNNSLNDAIPCLKLDYKNRNNSHLPQFLELFNIKQLRVNDLKLADKKSSPAEHFRRKLIEILPFLKKWLTNLSFPSDAISLVDKKVQQDFDFIESDSLELFYNQNFVHKTNVYFDNGHKQLYVTRPWNSETTFIDLPNKLCQLLNIHGFEHKLRFLLKGTIEEIKKHFIEKSIKIPTNQDIVILEPVASSNALKQPKLSATATSEPKKSDSSIKNQKTNSNKSEITPVTTEALVTRSNNQKTKHDTSIINSTQHCPSILQHIPFPLYVPSQVPIQFMNSPIDQYKRAVSSVWISSEDEQLDKIELTDLASNSVSLEDPFNGTEEFEGSYLNTGYIGEQMVYNYLVNKYRYHPNPVAIKWLNQTGESNLPYDIILTEPGKTHYIEVKSTRTHTQHAFPLSIHQIETFLRERENYFIYRVYIGEKKLVILDNIRWRLTQKQLACFLKILPISSYQTPLTSN